jgi:hypothetical protein
LAPRVDLVVACGVRFRKLTALHLQSLDESREYVATRYAPELAMGLSQINRLAATLDEVREKISPCWVRAGSSHQGAEAARRSIATVCT